MTHKTHSVLTDSIPVADLVSDHHAAFTSGSDASRVTSLEITHLRERLGSELEGIEAKVRLTAIAGVAMFVVAAAAVGDSLVGVEPTLLSNVVPTDVLALTLGCAVSAVAFYVQGHAFHRRARELRFLDWSLDSRIQDLKAIERLVRRDSETKRR